MRFQFKRRIAILCLLVLTAPAFLLAKETKPPKLTEEQQDALDVERAANPTVNIIILGTSRDFPSLKLQAQKIARAAALPFSLRDMIYDQKDGLHLPKNADVMWGGSYLFRRDETMTLGSGKESYFVSIEESDAYPGLKKGYYIIVGGICFDPRDLKKELALYKLAAPDAYAPKTTVYTGCLH